MSEPPVSTEARLRTLCEISRTITASLELDQVLSRICESAARLLEADAALITELQDSDDGAGVLRVRATTAAGIDPGDTLTIGGSLSGQAVVGRETLIVNDVRGDERVDRPMARAADVEQAVVAPLLHQGRPLGTIAVWNSRRRDSFDNRDGDLLGALAAQAAIAVRNAAIYAAQKQRREELDALKRELEESVRRSQGLVRAGMALNVHLSLDEVLQTLVDSARDVLRARYAALGVLDRAGTELARFVFSGVDQETADRIGPLPRGRGILGLIIREQKTLRLRDLSEHPAACGFPEGHPMMSSFLGVPVHIGDRVFGNLYLTEKIGAEAFTSEDEEIAELLAAQAAIAIENAHLYEQRNQFLAIVNHEIKNAAAGVLGWNDRLAKLTSDRDDRIAESAGYALQAARQLQKLVVDLLDLSQIEARRLELERRPVDLRALVREVTGSVQPSAEAQGIGMQIEGLDRRAITETDPSRVRQILLNLLSNALKFTEPGGRIELRLQEEEQAWTVTVTDTGPGIDPGTGDQVFEVGNAAGRTKGSGSGLGLAISRELARLLGGELSLLEAGHGASFCLRLPNGGPTEDRGSAG